MLEFGKKIYYRFWLYMFYWYLYRDEIYFDILLNMYGIVIIEN